MTANELAERLTSRARTMNGAVPAGASDNLGTVVPQPYRLSDRDIDIEAAALLRSQAVEIELLNDSADRIIEALKFALVEASTPLAMIGSAGAHRYGPEVEQGVNNAIAHICRVDGLSRGRGETMNEWQPINTAPRDKLVLLTPGDCRTSGFLHAVKVGGWVQDPQDDEGQWEIFGATWDPTHWMPLPAAP